MTSFLKLKLKGGKDCLVNVAHIQQVRQVEKGVRIWWGTAMQADEGGSYVDQDDFEHTLDEIMEKLHQLQVEILR